MKIQLSGVEAELLYEYLKAHESDIVNDINDFGALRRVFLEVMERRPGEVVTI